MNRIEILVEEKSMEEFLRIFLPKILPPNWQIDTNCFIRSFEGKSDLQKWLPKQIKVFSNWHEPIGVIVLQDQDSADCKKLKQKLCTLISDYGVLPYLVRIVCKELEAWYIGDFEAIQLAYPHFNAANYIRKAKFRNPDVCNAADELKKILPEIQKVSAAKKISPFLKIESNKSESFQQFVSGIRKFLIHPQI